MTIITKEQLLDAVGDFTWFWGQTFFISTSLGNFKWSAPSYDGDNIMTPFQGDITDFCKHMNIDYGRDKGVHFIKSYCGDQFTLIIPS